VYSLQRHIALKGFFQLVAQVLCVEPPKQGILCPFYPAGAREVQLGRYRQQSTSWNAERASKKIALFDLNVALCLCNIPLDFSNVPQVHDPLEDLA
jgi:hypothetical protein